MSAVDRLAAAMSRQDAAITEQLEQRGLRERRLADAKAQAMETMQKDAAVHDKYAAHMQELGKRSKEAGGWLTGKTTADRSHTMGFGIEDDDKPDARFAEFGARPGLDSSRPVAPPPLPVAPGVPGLPATVDVPPAVPTPAPSGAAPEEPAAPARRRGRHARDDKGFDDDDFSNNSWMVD
ncbi:hypothetical protein [Amycolatopsis regifaucium]|uniref:Uncharacterized protein n=1 Tax=Amycolatopsis regifaucium TaxID=546365 RepID=A0A154MEU5_9PSEU|nr:hypothetical protein [Amycolatopsis regifaucium]KZB82099.1 hypothetical protein AVL48_09130 [Amycolatopsis regifaucium]OKA05829.1 hypothetical protein ATP06_0221860 [Amycolatopsis regifaucium]SFG82560.1 hypothetical protein SAMN04489731_101607 [Amycolatopsis regifaucium]